MHLRRKKISTTRKIRWVALVILCVLSVVVTIGTYNMYRSYKRAQIKSQNAEYEYTQLQKRNADLESSIALLQTEQGKELELRKRFDVGYEGEKLLVFVDPKKEEEKTLTPVPWWRRMLWYFSF